MLPPQTRYFPANTGEAPAHPSTWGWWQIHQERAGITLLLHGSAGRRLWLSNCIPTLVKQQSNNVVIFKFKNTSAFLHYDDFCNELRCFCQAQDLHTLCRAPIPVVSPHQCASDPELSLQREGPLSTIPVPVVIVACLLRRGLALIHLELQVRKDTCKLHSKA